MPSIRRFDPAHDWPALEQLWRSALPRWPLAPAVFQAAVSGSDDQPDDILVVDIAGRLGGMIATQIQHNAAPQPPHGCMRALLVAPDERRSGLGTALYTAALEHLKRHGVRQLQLGGGQPRFWPGVPTDMPAATAFFEAHGWRWDHQVADMLGDLRQLELSLAIQQRVQQQQIRFGLLTPAEAPELLAFEEHESPSWASAFRAVVAGGQLSDILIGRDAGGQLVAALILWTAQASAGRLDVLWTQQLGGDCGALGCVGVAGHAQSMGIGSALVAYGMQLLRERGVRNCFLGWVWAVDFYRRLGFDEWQVYNMSTRDCAEL